MFCRHCGAKLPDIGPDERGASVCPRCGGALGSAAIQKQAAPAGLGLAKALCEICRRFGLDALRDGQRAVAYLADLAPGLKKEQRLLKLLFESGADKLLFEAAANSGGERETKLARARWRLTEEYWLSESAAEMVCDAFLYALCPEAAPEPEKPSTPPVQPPKPAAKPQPSAPARSGANPTRASKKLERLAGTRGRIDRRANPTRAAKKPGSILKRVIAAVFVIGLAVSFVIRFGPRTVTEGDYTFSVTKASAVLIEYNGSDTLIEVPGEVNGRPVAEIGEGAFAGNLSIHRVTLPESVAVIGENAFAGCSELRILVSGREEETEVAATAFTGCEQLSAIYTPNSDTTWIPGETGMIHLT